MSTKVKTISPIPCPHCGDDLSSHREGAVQEWTCAGCKMVFELASDENGAAMVAKGGFPPPINLHTLLANKDVDRHRAELQAIFRHPDAYNLSKDKADAIWFALTFINCALHEREHNKETIALLRFKLETILPLAKLIAGSCEP